MRGVKITRYLFDNLENRNAIIKDYEKIFIPSQSLSAYGEAEKWFKTLPKEQRYLGWDENIYPRYTYENIDIN